MNSIVIALTVAEPAKFFTVNTGSICTVLRVRFGDVPLRCEGWGQKLADSLSDIAVGTPILVMGELHIKEEQTERGREYYNVIKINTFEVLPTAIAINQINLVGRTGADPELRYFESGKVVSNTRLAVRRGKDNTDWINLTMWDKTAEVASDYAKKGRLIGVVGRIQFETWNDKQTNVLRHKLVVNVDKLDLLDSKKIEEVAA